VINAVAINEEDNKPKRRGLTLLVPVIPLITVAAVWYFADLGRFSSPEKVAEVARSLREDPWAFGYVLLAFSIGTMLFFPVTALIAGTTLAFDPLRGFSYAFAGALFAACVTYWTGRLAGSAALDYVTGPRIARFREEVRTHAFRASVIARFLPVGNFSMINMLVGSMRVPFGKYVLGNIVGIAPGVLLLTLFAEQITSAMRSPSKGNVALLAAAVALFAVFGIVLKRWLKRREAQADGGMPS
jgi:phospholipase D1/2